MEFGTATGDPQISAVTPATLYEGSVVILQIAGKKLDPGWTPLLCPPSTADKSAPQPSVGAFSATKSTTSNLQATLTAGPGTAGNFELYLADSTNKVYNTHKTIIINSSNDTKYQPCASPMGIAPANANLQCSFSPISYEVELAIFGKGVANRFVAVYVNIQNKNQDLQYLLQDVRGGFPEYVVSSYDKSVPHEVSVKEEQFSARAIVFRIASASASVLTGVAGFAGSAVLQQAANIFAGPAQTGLQNAIPDLSSVELSNLDQQGFTVTSTVIPKGSAIKVVAFIPSDILVRSATDQKKHKHHPLKTPNSFSTYKGEDLRNLFKDMTLEVAGTHVLTVNPSPIPTLKMFVPPLSALTDFKTAAKLMIEGSGLDSVKSVQLISGDGNTIIQGTLEALPTATSKAIDPNLAVLVTQVNGAAGPGKYEINFVLSDGKKIDTTQSLTIPTPVTPAVPVAPTLSSAILDKTPVPGRDVSAKLTVTGTNLVQGDTQVLVGTGANIVTVPLTTTDGKTGEATVKLPADYSATTTATLQSKSNTSLTSIAVKMTIHP